MSRLRAELGNGVLARDSALTAVALALLTRERPFEELLVGARRIGGDVDTIGAMAGAIWGAARGAGELPQASLGRLEERRRIEAAAAGRPSAAVVQRVIAHTPELP